MQGKSDIPLILDRLMPLSVDCSSSSLDLETELNQISSHLPGKFYMKPMQPDTELIVHNDSVMMP